MNFHNLNINIKGNCLFDKWNFKNKFSLRKFLSMGKNEESWSELQHIWNQLEKFGKLSARYHNLFTKEYIISLLFSILQWSKNYVLKHNTKYNSLILYSWINFSHTTSFTKYINIVNLTFLHLKFCSQDLNELTQNRKNYSTFIAYSVFYNRCPIS